MTKITKITLPTLQCAHCGHKWVPRKEELPLTCPKCRHPGWNRPKKNTEEDAGK